MGATTLYRAAGASSIVFVVLFTISIAAYWITGGISFRAWVPLFGGLVCFWLVAALGGYEHLVKSHLALARIGLGFASMAFVTLFLEAAVWGADRLARRAAGPIESSEPTLLLALFTSLHMMVLWFIGIWMAFWGAGFLRLERGGRAVGVPMLLVAVFNAVDYALARLGVEGSLVEVWHLGGQVMILTAFTNLGLLLLKSAPDADKRARS